MPKAKVEAELASLTHALLVLQREVASLKGEVARLETLPNRVATLQGELHAMRARMWPAEAGRKEKFIERWQAGEAIKDIAAAHGVSRQCVYVATREHRHARAQALIEERYRAAIARKEWEESHA